LERTRGAPFGARLGRPVWIGLGAPSLWGAIPLTPYKPSFIRGEVMGLSVVALSVLSPSVVKLSELSPSVVKLFVISTQQLENRWTYG